MRKPSQRAGKGRKNTRRTGDAILFTDWRALNPRGMDPQWGFFQERVLMLPPRRAEDDVEEVDPWASDLSSDWWWTGRPSKHHLRVFAAQEVLLNQDLIEKMPVYSLYAVQMLMTASVDPPDWLKRVFSTAVEKLSTRAVLTIDDAFTYAAPDQRLVEALHRRQKHALNVFVEVHKRIINGAALDDELYAAVAAELGLGPDLVQDVLRYGESRLGYTARRESRRLFPVRVKVRRRRG